MKFGNEKIVLVDGFKIRNMIDDDFGIIHKHSDSLGGYMPKFYIPTSEIWLDNRYADEADFLQGVMFFEVPKEIASYGEERNLMKKTFCKTGDSPNFRIKEVTANGLKIVYVDGKTVREHIDPEFILGGHEFVYDYIPKGEIWLDNKMDPVEIPYILIHEQVERDLMSNGKSYDVAHEFATVADKEKRRADGVASYAGDSDYKWFGKSDEEIIKQVVLK